MSPILLDVDCVILYGSAYEFSIVREPSTDKPSASGETHIMSHHSYEVSRQLVHHDYPFYALIMTAMRQADPDNLARLQEAFPETYAELYQRYHQAPHADEELCGCQSPTCDELCHTQPQDILQETQLDPTSQCSGFWYRPHPFIGNNSQFLLACTRAWGHHGQHVAASVNAQGDLYTTDTMTLTSRDVHYSPVGYPPGYRSVD